MSADEPPGRTAGGRPPRRRSSPDRPRAAGRARLVRRHRVRVVPVAASSSSPSRSRLVVARPSPGSSPPSPDARRRGGAPAVGILAAGSRLSTAKIVQEVVEQVAHRSAESSRFPDLTVGRRSGPTEALDGPAETRQHGLGQLVRPHGRGTRRLEAEGRADGERRAPRPCRIVGRHEPCHPELQSAGVLEDRARTARRRAPGRAGRAADRAAGPLAGATSRKLTTPSSSATHISASHQPSGASEGRPMPGPVACGRGRGPRARAGTTGRAAGVGRARPQDSSGRRRVRRAVRPRRWRGGSASGAAGTDSAVDGTRSGGFRFGLAPAPRRARRGRPRPLRSRARSPRPRRRSSGDTPAARPSTLRLGQERVGLGLEVGDLGFELESQDLAPDRHVGGRQRAGFGGHGALVRVFAADPRQEPVARPGAGRLGRARWLRCRSRSGRGGRVGRRVDGQDGAARGAASQARRCMWRSTRCRWRLRPHRTGIPRLMPCMLPRRKPPGIPHRSGWCVNPWLSLTPTRSSPAAWS